MLEPIMSSVVTPEKRGQGTKERYDACFSGPVFFGAGLICVGVAFYLLIPELVASDSLPPPGWKVSVFCALIVMSIFFIALANYRVRFRLRSGQWGKHPKTKTDIVELFSNSPPPSVSGEGWSYCIARTRTSSPPIVALRGNWSGLVCREGDDAVRVRTGTLFGELTHIFDGLDMALYDRPQFDQMTVGGAVRTCAHGWCSYAWFIDSVIGCEAIEKGTGKIIKCHQEDEDYLSILLGDKYVLLDVVIKGLPKRNLLVETKSFPSPDNVGESSMNGEKNASLDLSLWASAPYKMLFVYKKKILTKTGIFSDHPMEARVSNCALRLQYYNRLFCKAKDTEIVDSIADAHTIVQNVWAFEAFMAKFGSYLNMEIYTRNFDLAASLLPLTLFHRKRGGRTEFRMREVAGEQVYAIDGTVDVRRCCKNVKDKIPQAYFEWLTLLHKFGVTEAAIHKGKYIPPTIEPVQEITMENLWSTTNLSLIIIPDANA